MKEIEVRLFGVFRKYVSDSNGVRLQIPEEATVREVKSALATYLAENSPNFKAGEGAMLITDSAIANEERVMNDGDPIHPARTLAILPPVCGG